MELTDLATSAQMRGIEKAAIESGHASGPALMALAGEAVAAAILRHWPEGRRALVLCGPGNNGGDGYVVARILRGRGWSVTVLALGESDRLPVEAGAQALRWRALGPVAPLLGFDPQAYATQTGGDPDVIVDALFGIGLRRPLGDDLCGVLDAIVWRWPRVPRVAVDVPSGLCADSGQALGGRVLSADLTVTFHRAKPGQVLGEGPLHCGALEIADIGLSEPGGIELLRGPLAGLDKPQGHKFTHGHALVLTGGMGHTGAARLAARAALRIGAGLVTLGAPGSALMECAAQITALMLRRIETAEELGALLEDRRLNALVLGPGMGVERAAALLPAALAGERATVLDADALSALGETPLALHRHCLLTPHDGEFARLFPDLAERLAQSSDTGPAFSRLDAAREAAARVGATVLLKGPATVIAGPDGRLAVHAAVYGRAVPWLATAGAGDVLSGIAAGLMARGVAPFEAAATAAWLHAEAARVLGPGLIAEDLPEALPDVLRARIGRA